MDKKIMSFLNNYSKKQGWPECNSDKDYLEVLRSGEYLSEKHVSSHRWWDDVEVVVSFDGTLIMFWDGHANRDESPEDLGWEFDHNSVCFAEEYEQVVKCYRPIVDEA